MSRLDEARAYQSAAMSRVQQTPVPAGQKYAIGARVWVSEYWPHFPQKCWATVEHTYAHAYGGDDTASYSLNLDGHGSVSWYPEGVISLEPPK